MAPNGSSGAAASGLIAATERLPAHQQSNYNSDLVPLRPNVAKKSSAIKAIWFLGGNHVVKLLTSVEGDFDQQTLAKLTAVSRDVGELALSVESLVSDDFTVGGFEDDILAKIAKNTITTTRSSIGRLESASTTPKVKTDDVVAKGPTPAPKSSPGSPALTGSVPNPLSSYEPIPNPLARITPPSSPIYPLEGEHQRPKRRTGSPPSTQDVLAPKAKKTRTKLTR